MAHVQRPPVSLERAAYCLDRPLNSRTKAARLRKNYFFNRRSLHKLRYSIIQCWPLGQHIRIASESAMFFHTANLLGDRRFVLKGSPTRISFLRRRGRPCPPGAVLVESP